jgi:hypothetical protein
MLMFVATVVDYGFYMTRRVTVARAAMEGARMGAAVFEADNVAPGSMIVPIAESRAGEVLTDMGIQCPASGCTITVDYCGTAGGTTGGGGGISTSQSKGPTTQSLPKSSQSSQSSTTSACGDPPFDAIQVEVNLDYDPIFGLIPVPTVIREKQLFAVENQRDDVSSGSSASAF